MPCCFSPTLQGSAFGLFPVPDRRRPIESIPSAVIQENLNEQARGHLRTSLFRPGERESHARNRNGDPKVVPNSSGTLYGLGSYNLGTNSARERIETPDVSNRRGIGITRAIGEPLRT